MSELTFNFANHVPSSDVREIDADYNGRCITSTVEIVRAGTYVIAGGQVGHPNASGFDTFTAHSISSKTITGTKGDRRTIRLHTSISSGCWGVGIFRATNDIPNSSLAKAAPVLSGNALVWLLVGAAFLGIALLANSGSTHRSYPSAPTEREKEREKHEAGVRNILREYGPADQSEAEIERGARDVVDEWERVTK